MLTDLFHIFRTYFHLEKQKELVYQYLEILHLHLAKEDLRFSLQLKLNFGDDLGLHQNEWLGAPDITKVNTIIEGVRRIKALSGFWWTVKFSFCFTSEHKAM